MTTVITSTTGYIKVLQQDGLKSLIDCNTFVREHFRFSELNTAKEKRKRIETKEENYKSFIEHEHLFSKRQFKWENVTNDIYNMRQLSQMKHLSAVNNFIPGGGDDHPVNNRSNQWTFIDPSFFQEAFPLKLIAEYLKRPNLMFGTPIYDKALRLQCDLLQIFLFFHLKADFKFHSKLSGSKYKIQDPLTRIRVRETNRVDPDLTKKYFNEDFDLKEFIYKLYDDFFPNVTWRYIGAGHFAHRITLQITEFVFQLGLWDYDDHDRLVKILLEKSENLNQLEEVTIGDIRGGRLKNANFVKELNNMFMDIKEYLSLIILHIIMLVNDESLNESLSWKRQSKGVFKESASILWNNAYYKDEELNSIINSIMLKYLLRETGLEWRSNHYDFFSQKTKENLDNIFMMLTDVEYDVFDISKQLVERRLVDYHTNRVSGLEEIRKEALEIKMNLANMIDDVTSRKLDVFGSLETMLAEKKINKAVKFFCDWIHTFLDKGGQAGAKAGGKADSQRVTIPRSHADSLYFRQLALGEQNVVTILLTLTYLLEEMGVDDKTQSLRIVLSTITSVCEDNLINQAQLFLDQGLNFFRNLNRERPLMGAIVTTNIFKKNNQILYVNPETFEIILDFYTQKLTNLSFLDIEELTRDPKKGIKTILALHKFNNYFKELVDVEAVQTTQRRPYYDLVVQNTIKKVIKEKVLPILKDKDFLPKNENGKDELEIYEFDFRLLESEVTDSEIMAMAKEDSYTDSQLRGLIYELSISFLGLFNKVTRRMIYGSTFELMKDEAKYESFTESFGYLLSFKEGIYLKIEILKFFTNFNIFFSNQLLTKRFKNNKQGRVVYMETNIPTINGGVNGNKAILEEIASAEKLWKWHERNDPWLSEKIKEYYLQGVFPMIYKYTKGIISFYYVDQKLKNKSELFRLDENISGIFDEWKKFAPTLSKILGGAQIEQFIDESLLVSDVKEISKELKLKRLANMDEEELFYQELYLMRKKGENILHCIETVVPESLHHIFLKFSRLSGSKRPFNNTSLSQKFREQDYSSEFLENNKFDEQREEGSQATNELFKEFIEVGKYYSKEKEAYINNTGKENLVVKFLNNNPNLIPKCLTFMLKSIYEAFEIDDNADKITTEDAKDYLITKFFQSRYVYPYIKFLDRLIKNEEKIKIALYFLMVDKEKEAKEAERFASILQGVEQICEEGVVEFVQKPETKKMNRAIISIIFHLFTELGQFCYYKTFIDDNWKEVWLKFYTLGSFIKNLCENNAVYFKRFLATFKPEINGVNLSSNRTVFFDMYVRMESLCTNSLSWYIDDKRLVMADRPELFVCSNRIFEIVTEFVNGPCPKNQRTIYKYRTDMWIGMLDRDILDVNSTFYIIKDKILDYITGLIEGEGHIELGDDVNERQNPYLCKSYMSRNITPRMVFNIMYKTMKKLALYRLMARDPMLKKDILEKVKVKREHRFRRLVKEGQMTEEDVEEEWAKIRANESLYGAYEDKDSIITDEMLEVYQFKHFSEILSLYKRDTVFSGHIILKIALKLYSLLQELGVVSKSISMSIRTAKLKISKFYKQEVDLDDQVENLTPTESEKFSEGDEVEQQFNLIKQALIKLSEKLPEDLIFFMFILKISKRIEISVQLPSQNKRQTKLVYFPLMPSTFYLEERTKERLPEVIDLDRRRTDFMEMFPQFFQEMEGNYQFALKNRMMYLLTKNGTFYFQKFVCYIISLCINILVIDSYLLDSNSVIDERRLYIKDDGKKSMIRISSLTFAAYAAINWLLWVLFRYNLQRKVRRLKFIKENRYENLNSIKNLVLVAYETLVYNKSAINFLLHCVFSILGIFINPVFLTLNLALVVNISDTAWYVVKASTMHFRQLMTTLMLAMFLIYSASVIQADFYSGSWDGVQDIDFCQNLRSCVVYMSYFGFRNGGGIGDSKVPYPWSNDKVYSNTIFDLGFFFLVNVISLNIIFGIIIDTFSELRISGEERRKFFVVFFTFFFEIFEIFLVEF